MPTPKELKIPKSGFAIHFDTDEHTIKSANEVPFALVNRYHRNDNLYNKRRLVEPTAGLKRRITERVIVLLRNHGYIIFQCFRRAVVPPRLVSIFFSSTFHRYTFMKCFLTMMLITIDAQHFSLFHKRRSCLCDSGSYFHDVPTISINCVAWVLKCSTCFYDYNS